MVSVGALADVAIDVARCGLLGGFLRLGLWLRCSLIGCAKRVGICLGRLEGFHIVGSVRDEVGVYHSLSRTKEG